MSVYVCIHAYMNGFGYTHTRVMTHLMTHLMTRLMHVHTVLLLPNSYPTHLEGLEFCRGTSSIGRVAIRVRCNRHPPVRFFDLLYSVTERIPSVTGV